MGAFPLCGRTRCGYLKSRSAAIRSIGKWPIEIASRLGQGVAPGAAGLRRLADVCSATGSAFDPVALIDTERGPEGVYAEACTIIAEWIQSATFSADIAGCTAARTSVCANPDVADPSWWDTTLTR